MITPALSPSIAPLARFFRDSGGTTAAIFALAIIPLLGAAAAALDYTRAAQTRAKLQSVVDAAVLNGLKASTSQRPAVAETFARSALQAQGLGIDQLSFTPTANQGLRGRVRVRIESLFGNVLGTQGLDIAAGAEGFLKTGGSGSTGRACILLTDPSAAETLRVNGGASVKAPNCEVHIQTTANVGAVFNGNSSFDVRRICLKGPGYIANGQPKLGPVETGCAVAGDPFAGQIAAPANLVCTFSNKVFEAPKGRRTTELEPGVYCGSTTFLGSQHIVLKPGLYAIKNGAMTIGGGSSLTGAGVTFYLADADASLQVKGNGTIQLSAPSSSANAYSGVLIFEPNGLRRSAMAINGGGEHRLDGLIYLPSRNLTFAGGSTLKGDTITLVLNSLTVNGGGGTEWTFDAAAKTIAAPTTRATTAEIILRY